MNYAWSNPSTGVREQTNEASPERMLAEAKRRVWEELQPPNLVPGEWQIYRQTPLGNVSLSGPFVDPSRVIELNRTDPDYTFAWADPITGIRLISNHFPGDEVVEQIKTLQAERDPTAEVIVYANWPECVVFSDDPEPPVPAAEPAPVESNDEIGKRKAEINTVIVLDDQTRIAAYTAWALLDIAESLREIENPTSNPEARHYFIPMGGFGLNRVCVRCGRLPEHQIHIQLSSDEPRQRSLWQRFCRWLLGD